MVYGVVLVFLAIKAQRLGMVRAKALRKNGLCLSRRKEEMDVFSQNRNKSAPTHRLREVEFGVFFA
jgi:hypothetical protein